MVQSDQPTRRVVSGLPLCGFVVAVLSVLTIMLAGLGSRWGWWHFSMGFTILKWGVYGGIAAGLISLIGLVMATIQRNPRFLILGITGLVVGLLTVGVPWSWLKTARSVPAIHDITTDTENPPRFVAILSLRKDAPNPAEYGGPALAAQQRAGYPDLGPKILSVPPIIAFERALAAVRKMGWQIVDANPSEGRIEATDTTFWFGFKDDIVIRITPAEGGSRVNVRSVSRVGRSDVGTNAKRIRKFLERL